MSKQITINIGSHRNNNTNEKFGNIEKRKLEYFGSRLNWILKSHEEADSSNYLNGATKKCYEKLLDEYDNEGFVSYADQFIKEIETLQQKEIDQCAKHINTSLEVSIKCSFDYNLLSEVVKDFKSSQALLDKIKSLKELKSKNWIRFVDSKNKSFFYLIAKGGEHKSNCMIKNYDTTDAPIGFVLYRSNSSITDGCNEDRIAEKLRIMKAPTNEMLDKVLSLQYKIDNLTFDSTIVNSNLLTSYTELGNKLSKNNEYLQIRYYHALDSKNKTYKLLHDYLADVKNSKDSNENKIDKAIEVTNLFFNAVFHLHLNGIFQEDMHGKNIKISADTGELKVFDFGKVSFADAKANYSINNMTNYIFNEGDVWKTAQQYFGGDNETRCRRMVIADILSVVTDDYASAYSIFKGSMYPEFRIKLDNLTKRLESELKTQNELRMLYRDIANLVIERIRNQSIKSDNRMLGRFNTSPMIGGGTTNSPSKHRRTINSFLNIT